MLKAYESTEIVIADDEHPAISADLQSEIDSRDDLHTPRTAKRARSETLPAIDLMLSCSTRPACALRRTVDIEQGYDSMQHDMAPALDMFDIFGTRSVVKNTAVSVSGPRQVADLLAKVCDPIAMPIHFSSFELLRQRRVHVPAI